jgi:CRISPR-associated protein (TIGR02584 family)
MERPEQDDLTYYTLVATLGSNPAVVTETIWSFATDALRPMHPASVHLVTTARGRRIWEDTVAGAVWPELGNDVLGGTIPDPEFHIPREPSSGQPLEDIQNSSDDRFTANRIWSVVWELTQPGTPPLVALLAGGRKTMSSHLQSSMEFLARPTDQLVHVVGPRALEQRSDPPFYYPAPGERNPGISRITIDFPPLRRRHERGLFQQVDDPSDREAVMEAANRHAYPKPARIRLWAGAPPETSVQAAFLDEEGAFINACQLTPRHLATLLVVAEHIARGDDRTVHKKRLRKERAEQQRRLVYWCCYEDADKPWAREDEDGADWRQQANDRISRAIGGLKTRVEGLPIAEDYLTFESDGQNRHRWRRDMPALEVVLDETKYKNFSRANTRSDGEQLFRHLPFVSAAEAAR